ncbi:sporulation-delaying protein SdpB family protein [Curtobacterium sp. ER1/6]|uniref:sporulation-delaying protein SdpB family protein n=1 Tax=Curtobacterium sp. ER1/6 TaxID=1891920 RepID=UPI0016715147|nr:sporulation-delaying protein SdpB family protein [Curtobacterium sp. ER1/6]
MNPLAVQSGLVTEWRSSASAGKTLLRSAADFIDDVSPYNSSVAIARSLLALSTLLTFLLTPRGALFLSSPENPDGVVCDAATARWSLFCAAGGSSPLSLMIVVAVTLAVLSGYLPAVTAVPHWWVSWSLNIGSPVRDGGDQVAAVLTLLLVPLLLLDGRSNHWVRDGRWASRTWGARGTAWAMLVIIWIQAAVLYANAAIAKFAVVEWANGTALWYWIQDPSFRPPGPLVWLIEAAQGSLFGTVAVNYGVMALELFAAALFFVRPSIRTIALPVLLAFHLCIGVAFGLWSFFLSMAALLVLYLRVPRIDRTD